MRRCTLCLLFALVLTVSLSFFVNAETETSLNSIDNSSISEKFAEGTTTAVCPKCGGEPVVWTALNDTTDSGSNLDAGHYYLSGDYGTYLSISGEKEVCIHLNGYNWIQANKSRALYMSGTKKCVVNIMGEGTVCGSDGYTDRTTRGATVEVNGAGAVLNLLGGTYTKNAETSGGVKISGPTVALYTSGGLINMYAGATITGGEDAAGTNVRLPAGTFHMYGGTITGGKGGQGGNVYVTNNDTKSAGTFIMEDGLISNGTTTGYGGNVRVEGGDYTDDTVPNGVFEMRGGTISGGSAQNNGGNIYVTESAVATICGTVKDNVSAANGGNIACAGHSQVTLRDVTVSGGKAETSGENIYQVGSASITIEGNVQIVDGIWWNTQKGAVIYVAETFSGVANIYFEKGHLTDPVYGTALIAASCGGSFEGKLYLAGDYGYPEIYGMEDGNLYVFGAQVVGDDTRWAANIADALASAGENEYIKLYAPCEINVPEGKEYTIDLNGQDVSITGSGAVQCFDSANDNFVDYGSAIVDSGVTLLNPSELCTNGKYYITMAQENVYTFHCLDMYVSGVAIRPSVSGIYYTGTWGCDDVLLSQIASYGVAVDAVSMPQNNFLTNESTLYTTFDAASFVSGENKTGAIISGILNESRNADLNNAYGRTPVFAATYVTLKSGTTIVSPGVGHSLYSAMKALEELCEQNPAAYVKPIHNASVFYENWKDKGMESWDFDRISAEYNILFIGNSYTYYNDMPTAYFESMARASGYNVSVTAITKGSYTLEKYANPTDAYGSIVAQALSVSGAFDYVVIQEFSTRPITDPEKFYAAARTLSEMIRNTGAEPILYATWGRQTGSSKLTELNMTNEEMTWALAKAYATIGQELQIPVCNVGIAFLEINNAATINLYDADMTHPNELGSYLAAMTLLGGIFEVDPVTAPFTGPAAGDVDLALREAAAKAVFEAPAIDQMPA